MRRCINEIQKNVIDGVVDLDSLIKVKDVFVENLYNIVKQGLALKARKKVIENEHVFSGDYTELLRSLFDYVCENKQINEQTKTQNLLTISEHLYRAAFVADPEINFYSCLLSLK